MSIFIWSPEEVAKLPRPTHKLSFYGLRCFSDERTATIWGVNPAVDLLIDAMAWLHNLFVPGNPFPFRVIEEYEKGWL